MPRACKVRGFKYKSNSSSRNWTCLLHTLSLTLSLPQRKLVENWKLWETDGKSFKLWKSSAMKCRICASFFTWAHRLETRSLLIPVPPELSLTRNQKWRQLSNWCSNSVTLIFVKMPSLNSRRYNLWAIFVSKFSSSVFDWFHLGFYFLFCLWGFGLEGMIKLKIWGCL